jgi:hypothetical protein
MQFPRIEKKLKVRVIIIIVLAVVLFLLMQLADHPAVIERYYSQGVYRVICHILHPIFNLFPFSFGDLLYIFVIGYLLYAFVRLIRLCFKKHFKQAINYTLGWVIGIQSAIVVFYVFWGMNYFRPPASERLHLRDTTYSTADLMRVTTILIDSANVTRARLTPADLAQNNSQVYASAINAIKKLSTDSASFRTYYPDIKSSLLTPLLNYLGTSGYYDPFTGEAQMNYQMPVFTRPVTACHELSHQEGYATEDEANFAGYLAGIGSKDRLLRYSAYNLAVEEFMVTLFFRDSLANKRLKPLVSPAVHNDYKEERAYWRKYETQINAISSIFYDHFLKANNQPQGLETYDRMVLLVMATYREKLRPDTGVSSKN